MSILLAAGNRIGVNKELSASSHNVAASPESARRREVSGLTGLRFFAALSVVLSHGADQILRLRNSTFTYWLSQSAGFGMVLFFVLSGFVIHYNYRKTVTQGGVNGLGSFIWARFSRLYPLYFFILALDVLLGQRLYEFMTGNSEPIRDLWSAIPYHLTLTQTWIYKAFSDSSLVYVTGRDAGVTWSIATEWFFYLCYPLAALFVIRIQKPGAAMLASVGWCVLWISLVIAIFGREPSINARAASHFGAIASSSYETQDSFFRWLMYFSPYLRIGEFILGCFVAQVYVLVQERKPGPIEQAVGRFFLAVGIISIPVLTYLMYAGSWPYIRMLNYNFGLAPSVAIILFCSARYETFISRTLNAGPIIALGEASYSIYLIHFIVFVISASLLGGTFATTLPNVIYLSLKFLLLLMLILVVSLGLHAYIEVPARRWLRSLWPQSGRSGSPALAYSIFAAPGIVAALVWIAVAQTAISGASIPNGLRVLSATYGPNCAATWGNATKDMAKTCDGKNTCQYTVDVEKLGDPAAGCAKNFVVDYQCAPAPAHLIKTLPAEAGLRSKMDLSCPAKASNSGSKPSAK
jgi:peptidoglycan/LPS O-acetylase OafA/YrhL